MAQIHPSSLVDPQAKLAENVVVGPFCTIGPHVEVGEGTTLQSHIVLTGHTKIGRTTRFMPLQRSVSILRIKNTAARKLS